jgi:hypothetical protein
MFVSTIDQVTISARLIVTLILRQETWYTVLRNTRLVQVIKQNFVTSTMAKSLLLVQLYLPFGSGWHAPMLQLLGSYV